MPTASASDLKDGLRRAALARRDALPAAWRQSASQAIATRALAMAELSDTGPVAAYWPIRSEVDARPLIEALLARGQDVALSQVRHPRLRFCLWRPGEALAKGGFGVPEPGPDALEVFPRVLIVPLAAFDRRGWRIGYGKGHFDRAIAALAERHPVRTIGLAFSAQEVDSVPVEAHDRHLDIIVTEAEVIAAVAG